MIKYLMKIHFRDLNLKWEKVPKKKKINNRELIIKNAKDGK